ncbi:MAG: response regulator, partial [Oscillospiraceae bacterium]|nr:response regulator [Oscillospiraceae bacterium]
GMSTTKNLVDRMCGTIAVESELDKGTTFIVELELRIPDESVRESDTKFWSEHKLARMIVADDDEQICRNIAKMMAGTGVAVDYATDGETAVQMMRSAREAGQPYDLILLDWQMPTLNGLETTRLIRKNYSDKVPIILLTAYDWDEIEAEARELGIVHFMPKPFFVSTFKSAVQRVMAKEEKESRPQSDVVRGKHVLVVDDIAINRMILTKILTTLGAQCDDAANGQEALEKFEASQPGEYDMIFMDIQMPVMDGHEATRAIRSSGHPMAGKIPVIAITANAFVDDVREALEAGMDAHLAKPVQVETLKATIQQVLDSRAAAEDQ